MKAGPAVKPKSVLLKPPWKSVAFEIKSLSTVEERRFAHRMCVA
jgi:hypothetical protein